MGRSFVLFLSLLLLGHTRQQSNTSWSSTTVSPLGPQNESRNYTESWEQEDPVAEPHDSFKASSEDSQKKDADEEDSKGFKALWTTLLVCGVALVVVGVGIAVVIIYIRRKKTAARRKSRSHSTSSKEKTVSVRDTSKRPLYIVVPRGKVESERSVSTFAVDVGSSTVGQQPDAAQAADPTINDLSDSPPDDVLAAGVELASDFENSDSVSTVDDATQSLNQLSTDQYLPASYYENAQPVLPEEEFLRIANALTPKIQSKSELESLERDAVRREQRKQKRALRKLALQKEKENIGSGDEKPTI